MERVRRQHIEAFEILGGGFVLTCTEARHMASLPLNLCQRKDENRTSAEGLCILRLDFCVEVFEKQKEKRHFLFYIKFWTLAAGWSIRAFKRSGDL